MNKMDQELSEKIDKLKSEKKILARKLLELSNTFKSTIARLEKKYDDRMNLLENKIAQYENKSSEEHNDIASEVVKLGETLNENIETLKKNEVQLSDDVSNLETERKHVANKINVIDIALSTVEGKIETFEKTVSYGPENDARKICAFHNKGYCREQNCPFFHADLICQIYKLSGKCWKQNCRLRHPKVCRYGFECYRGESCRYFHDTLPCGRCESYSQKHYYCEFCKRNFCDGCTVEQAHIKNIYDNENSEHPNCESIHLSKNIK